MSTKVKHGEQAARGDGADAQSSQRGVLEFVPVQHTSKIRVKDITDAAGYNRATFYQYYRDIPDLFAQAEDELLDAITELITTHLGDLVAGDFEADMEFLASTAQKYRTVMSVLLSERGDPKFVRKFKDLIVPLIDQGVDYLNLNGAQARLFREFSLAGIVAAVSAWLSDDSGMTVADFVLFLSSSCSPQKCASREEFDERWGTTDAADLAASTQSAQKTTGIAVAAMQPVEAA